MNNNKDCRVGQLTTHHPASTAISPVMLPDDPLLLSKGFPGDHVCSVRACHFVLTIIVFDHLCNVDISTATSINA